jgi:hypothetical protein
MDMNACEEWSKRAVRVAGAATEVSESDSTIQGVRQREGVR